MVFPVRVLTKICILSEYRKKWVVRLCEVGRKSGKRRRRHANCATTRQQMRGKKLSSCGRLSGTGQKKRARDPGGRNWASQKRSHKSPRLGQRRAHLNKLLQMRPKMTNPLNLAGRATTTLRAVRTKMRNDLISDRHFGVSHLM